MTRLPKNYGTYSKGVEVCRFINSLQHTKGEWAGRPFDLMPWQKGIVKDLFDTRQPDGLRQYRKALIGMPRKNGKTTLGAGLALYGLIADGEMGAEVYSCAADKLQARLVFQQAREFMEASRFAPFCEFYRDAITVPSTKSVYRVLSADAITKHGLNPHFVIFDELHAQPDRELWDVMTSGFGARRQPMVVAITTAGYDRRSICWEMYDYGRQIEKGIVKDPRFYFVWYGLDPEQPWDTMQAAKIANPALGRFLKRPFLKDELREAKALPGKQNTYRQLYLNQWTQQETRFVDLRLWDDQAGMVDESKLAGRLCYGGLDIAAVSDFTAWVLVFPDDDGGVTVLARFFLPEESLREGRNKDLYRVWAQQGWLTITPGPATDQQYVKTRIMRDAAKFDLREFNVDSLFQGKQLEGELVQEGLTPVTFRQGHLSYALPMKMFERLLLERKIRHGGNPILRFCADNLVVRQDAAGNLKPDKEKSLNKIDGIVGLVMGLDRIDRAPQRKAYKVAGF